LGHGKSTIVIKSPETLIPPLADHGRQDAQAPCYDDWGMENQPLLSDRKAVGPGAG
jgi:hypothetical protein